jgi:hypothetical protein
MNPITTDHATIRTATVSVKVLTLDKKQMTLSVFRQLPCEHIVDPETRSLRGTPWGTVNYFWKDCGFDGVRDHLHVVWEKEGRLYRACIGSLIPFNRFTDFNIPHLREAFVGDPIGLELIGEVREVYEFGDILYHAFPELSESECSDVLDWWSELYDRLAALDQLFIAV